MTTDPSGDPRSIFRDNYDIGVGTATSSDNAEGAAQAAEEGYMTMPPVDKPRWSNIKARIISQE